ncbi:MAG: hypothetical protein NUV91_01860 [Candidatus Omnitrophica bacterium]|nr:hypothetical protein [Candidatus Omnitrophota bacterium]
MKNYYFSVLLLSAIFITCFSYNVCAETNEYPLYMKHFMEGQVKKSYEAVEGAIQANPNDQAAKDFKKTLDHVFKKQPHSQIPETIPVHGQELVSKVLEKKIEVKLGNSGDRDLIELPSGTVSLLGPQGWRKKAETVLPNRTQMLIIYNKSANDLPVIAVSADELSSNQSVLEFAQKTKETLQNVYQMKVSEPKEEVVNGQKLIHMDYSGQGARGDAIRFNTYQFLMGKKVMTVQYANIESRFDREADQFGQVIQSLEIK